MTDEFVMVDAKTGLGSLDPKSVSVVVCSPPYFRCRDYAPDSAHTNAIGDSVQGTSTQLGHEETPEEFAYNLAECFGDGNYLTDTGSLWIVIGDTFARKSSPTTTAKEAIGIHHMLVAEMRSRKWRLWQEIVWAKPSVPPSGAAQVRCNPSKEYILWFVRPKVKPFFMPREIREEGSTPAGKIMPPVGGKKYGTYTRTLVSDGKRCRQDVWTICPSRNSGAHVAPFPEDIPRLIIAACTNEGDTVCDPFAGTLTTGRVAKAMGRSSVCFDIYDHSSRKREAEREIGIEPKKPRGASGKAEEDHTG
jgi:site-specific DNA-methyltransferase (cytosine-N4-specific)